MQYIDPITPKIPDPNDKSEHPKMIDNWTDVTPQHIQMLALNVQDPTKVQEAIMGVRSAQAAQALEASKAEAALRTSRAAETNANAHMRHENTNLALAPSREALNLARASAVHDSLKSAATRAAASSRGALTAAQAQAAATGGSKAMEALQQGVMETNTNEDSKGFGTPMRNNENIPYYFKKADGKTKLAPEDLYGQQAFAGKIMAANVGMGGPAAAEIAAKIYHNQHIKMQTHTGPDGKTPVANVRTYPDGTIGLWDKGTGDYLRIKTYPELLDEVASGVDQRIYAPAEGEEADPYENPADNAPAIPAGSAQ
jgi:hypothetical protein